MVTPKVFAPVWVSGGKEKVGFFFISSLLQLESKVIKKVINSVFIGLFFFYIKVN